MLRNFYLKIQPGGPGWAKIVDEAKEDNVEIVKTNEKWSVPSGIKAMLSGVVLIYSIMFATGYWIYGEYQLAIILTIVVALSAFVLLKVWQGMKNVL